MDKTRRIRIPVAAKLAPVVVVAGTALGWLLGSAADPVMKSIPQPEWPAMPRAESVSAPIAQEWPEVAPQDFPTADGYRSDLDYDAAAGSEWELPDDEIGTGDPLPVPMNDAFEASARAEKAAEDAQRTAVVPPANEPQAELEARKSRLVQAGLY